jgi:hypothetical protein
MDSNEQQAKMSVLKGISKFMGKLNAEKFKPKKVEPPKEEKKEEDEMTPEMLEKLKAFYAEKKEE